jgi:hypothetical protein
MDSESSARLPEATPIDDEGLDGPIALENEIDLRAILLLLAAGEAACRLHLPVEKREQAGGRRTHLLGTEAVA